MALSLTTDGGKVMLPSGPYKDSDLFPIGCPSCGHKFREQIGRLKTGGELWCPSCGATIRYEKAEFLRALGQLRRGLYDFKGAFLTAADDPSKFKH
jgi:uncharacterized C2H2 Zn-finger protein